jgi:hypothetical protein
LPCDAAGQKPTQPPAQRRAYDEAICKDVHEEGFDLGVFLRPAEI